MDGLWRVWVRGKHKRLLFSTITNNHTKSLEGKDKEIFFFSHNNFFHDIPEKQLQRVHEILNHKKKTKL